jgi:hypothetical protein
MSLTFSKWRRKSGHNPKYSVYDGRSPLGTVFESGGVFTAVTATGDLTALSTSLKVAVDSLCPTTGALSS